MKRVRRCEEASDDARTSIIRQVVWERRVHGVKSLCYVLALRVYTLCIHVVCKQPIRATSTHSRTVQEDNLRFCPPPLPLPLPPLPPLPLPLPLAAAGSLGLGARASR